MRYPRRTHRVLDASIPHLRVPAFCSTVAASIAW